MASGINAPHHDHRHTRVSRVLRAQWYADPNTRCWKCSRTIDQVRITKPRAKWVAGHVVRAQVGGPYLPECSECSGREGASITNAKPRTELTW